MVIYAVYENGVFRPTVPVELPESCPVKLVVNREARVNSQASPTAPLSKLAAIAAEHSENPNLPTDLAEQHDHYLYGTPKRS
jgi:predicted DNA-binding antitoxin AbrB/MazE fold protein